MAVKRRIELDCVQGGIVVLHPCFTIDKFLRMMKVKIPNIQEIGLYDNCFKKRILLIEKQG